jgi:hypothetical protein
MSSRKLTKPGSLATCIVALSLLSGCVIMDGPAPGGRIASRSGPAEGNWGDTGGVATSSFMNGSFVTVANDTGNRLAEGSYRYVDSSNVEINFTSLVRQQQVRTNCLIITPSQMNCTSDSGSQFTLYRRATVG